MSMTPAQEELSKKILNAQAALLRIQAQIDELQCELRKMSAGRPHRCLCVTSWSSR